MHRTASECIEHMLNNIQSGENRLLEALRFSFEVPEQAAELRVQMATRKELAKVLRELLDDDRLKEQSKIHLAGASVEAAA